MAPRPTARGDEAGGAPGRARQDLAGGNVAPGRPLSLFRAAPWVLALALAACRLPYVPPLTPAPPAAGVDLRDANGRVVGRAVFLQEWRRGVRLIVDVKGVPPGVKGIHIHAVGRCDPPSFESAGPHFNPTQAEHGTANPQGPHAGDLPNITVDVAGQGHLEVTELRITLEKGAASLFSATGTALVLHADPDDLRTDPAGKSGARIACGVITRAG